MSARWDESQGFHPWRLVRRDIGRKATALAMAVLLWIWLSNEVGTTLADEDHPVLGVAVVESMEEALAATQRNAVFLIVPDDLIVRDDLSDWQVTIQARGLKDELRGVRLAGYVPLSVDDLQGDQERQIDIQLQDRRLFQARNRGNEPELRDFEVRVSGGGGLDDATSRGLLRLTIARKKEASFLLGPDNVTITGAPRDGYAFDQTAIRVQPNRVKVSGPGSRIDDLLSDPARLKVGPVDLDGRGLDVSQQVGIDLSRVDRSVSLDTQGGVVEVTVPIRARDTTIELAGVPVHYVGTEQLAARGLRVVSADATLDLRVSGPRSVLGGVTPEELVKLIHVKVDWTDVLLLRGNEQVHIFRETLPEAPIVRITDRADDPPRVEYHLETISMDDASSSDTTAGDSP